MLINRYHFLLLLSVFSILSEASFGAVPPNSYATKQEQLSKAVETFVEKGLFNGVVLVAQDDSILLHKGYGFADCETKEPITIDAKFRLGCISKQFTAVAIMQLVEKGLIDINADIRTYLPEFPIRNITIQHILTMSDGLPCFWNLPDFDKDKLHRREEVFADICASMHQKELAFTPGSHLENTHTGYELLSVIIERVTKLSFEQYLKQNIFDRIGMTQTGCGFACCSQSSVGTGYILDESLLKKSPSAHSYILPSATGLYATAHDVYAWMQAYSVPQRLLSQKSLDQMFGSYLQVPSKYFSDCLDDAHYGYGVIIARISGKPCIGHFGKILGFRGTMFKFSYRNSCIIVLSNFKHANVGALTKALADILFDPLYNCDVR